MSQRVNLIYPERRSVLEAVIRMWAEDALRNNDPKRACEGEIFTTQEAIAYLEDLGEITTDGRFGK